MRTTGSRRVWSAVLVVALVVLAWLLLRGAGTGGDNPAPATGPSHSASRPGTTTPDGRHTGSATGSTTDPASGLAVVDESALPPEARHTLALIRAGGPYPYPRNDDQVFTNRERVLPPEPRGYYREFTVETPGSPDRGARRIVTGAKGEKYYTDDHYQSFRWIKEGA